MIVGAPGAAGGDLGKRKFDDMSSFGCKRLSTIIIDWYHHNPCFIVGSFKKKKVYIPVHQNPDINYLGIISYCLFI
jgi:hypothetical protein